MTNIQLSTENLSFTYPDGTRALKNINIEIEKGEKVAKGEIIGKVGPKYIAAGKLNGATTGVHLHLGVLKNGEFIDPLSIFYEKWGL